MRSTALLLLPLLFVVCVRADDVKFKVVNIEQGPVKGYKSMEGNFYAFYGIPYAGTPTGRDKFKPPLAPPVWTETFEAVTQNVICPQPLLLGPNLKMDEENCLITNVFIPDTEVTNLPVVIWIHGGAYQVGSGNIFLPYGILEKGNFIAVNFNYRVGVQGFLCLGTEDIPGNAGLKDMVAALRWVKKNIAKFGGNSDDISLTGYSAGSSAVELLLLSETTKGLFNKVIPESGAALGVWSMQSDPLANAKRLARQLNFTNVDDIYVLEEFLKTATFEQLTADLFFEERDSTFVFEPCLERDTGNEMIFKEAPIDIMEKGNFPIMPILMGFANLGHLRASLYNKWKDAMNVNLVDFVPADLQFESKEQKEAIAYKIKNFYFGDKPISDENVQRFYDFFGDVMFYYGTIRAIKYYLKAGNNNVYLYEYSYIDDIILQTRDFPNVRGATHCAQSFAIIDLPPPNHNMINDTPDNKEYKKMKNLMRKTWINFIQTGKPVPETTSDFPEGWPAVSTADGTPYMDLNLSPTLHKTPLLDERVRFWDEIYDSHYRKPIPPPELPPRKSGHSEL